MTYEDIRPQVQAFGKPIAQKHGYTNVRSDEEKEILFEATYKAEYFRIKIKIHFVDEDFAGVHAIVRYDPEQVEEEDIRKMRLMGVNICIPYAQLQTFIDIVMPNMIETAKLD